VIQTNNTTPLDARLTLGYAESELPAGIDEAALRLYRYDGSRWITYTSQADPAHNLVTSTQVITAFSVWAIGAPGHAPTAVNVQDVRKQYLLLPEAAAVGVILLAGGLGMWAMRRARKSREHSPARK
jgi:hypothetical protein